MLAFGHLLALSPTLDPSLTATTSAASGFDPVVATLLSVFGGVALTTIAGFIGAWIQGRREHVRWVRERRFDAFRKAVQLLGHMETFTEARDEPLHDYYMQMLGGGAGMTETERLKLEKEIVDVIGPRMTAAEEMATLRTLEEEKLDTSSTLELVGTAEVEHWLGFVINAMTMREETQLKIGRAKLRASMRAALGIKDESSSRRRSRSSLRAVIAQSSVVEAQLDEDEALIRTQASRSPSQRTSDPKNPQD